MRTHPLLLAAGLLGLAAPFTLQAQNYRPFGPGRTYHYREAATVTGAPDELYTFRVDSMSIDGNGDSLLLFNATERLHQQGYGSPRPGMSERVNLYGGWMHWSLATGIARFGAAGTSTVVELRTRAPLGQSWPLAGAVQATISARTVQPVRGQPDSVLTVSLSDGNTLLLSRRYGIVAGPDFTFYLGRTYRPDPPTQVHQLTLAGLPEAGLAGVDMTWPAIVDLQPGDSLVYATRARSDGNTCIPACSYYDRTGRIAQVVRSRRLSANGDTLIVAVDNVTTAGATSADPHRYLRQSALLSAAPIRTPYQTMGVYAIRQSPDSLDGRPVAYANALIPDATFRAHYASGLGATYHAFGLAYCCWDLTEQRLIGFYQNRNQPLRWGDTRVPAPLTATAATPLPLPASLVPNPAPVGTAPALTFSLDQPQHVSLTLHDATGRSVWQQTTALAVALHRLAVAPGTALAPGLYRLRVATADGRQCLLPLMRE